MVALRLELENIDTLPDGGPISLEVKGRRSVDIGRNTYLDWTLPDPSRVVSGRHCEIHYRDGGYWLTDISTNGTYLNGSDTRLTEPAMLKTGDRIFIGDYIVAVTVEGEGESVAQGAASAPPPIADDPAAAGSLWDISEPDVAPVEPKRIRRAEATPVTPDVLDWIADIPDLAKSPPPQSETPPESEPPQSAQPDEPPAPAPTPPPEPEPEPAALTEDEPQAPREAAEPAPPQPAEDLWQPAAPPIATLGNGSDSSADAAHAAPADEVRADDAWKELDPDPPRTPPPVEEPGEPEPLQEPPPEEPAPEPQTPPQSARGFAAAVTAAAPAPIPAGASGEEFERFIGALCEALDVPRERLAKGSPEELGDRLGQFIQLTISGMQRLLKARATSKGLLRAGPGTQVQAVGNNPLKFMPTPAAAADVLFGPPSQSYLSVEDTLDESFADLGAHQMALYSAMQGAVQRMMKDLEPDAIEGADGEERGGFALPGLSSKKAKMWDTYKERYHARASQHDNGMVDVFMLCFSDAYDRALKD